MDWIEEQFTWDADGKPVTLGLTRHGSGPTLLLLPALSSISTRDEMRGLQARLGARFTTWAVDWPGFGTLPRPRVAWTPGHYARFLRDLVGRTGQPAVTVAAGHGAGYAVRNAAERPGSLGRLCLLSPTWRGPLPTMAGKRMGLFRMLAGAVDLPGIGAGFYRLNVNGPVIGMMSRGHVYAAPDWLTEDRMAAKRKVTEASGARYASFRFVAGELDPFPDRASWLAAAGKAGQDLLSVYGAFAPRKSKAEMEALGTLPNVESVEMPIGKLSFYEEFPDETAEALLAHIV